MGIATFLIAFVPTYASIGIWGAVILTVLRMIQGIGVGGEWGGSVLLAMEWARTHGHRGLVASWPQFGVPCGLFLANLAVLAFSQMSGDQFITWGWRIPFALSIILVGVGLWIWLGILETPVFQQLLNTKKIEKAPIIEVFKKHPKEIFLSALAASVRASTVLHLYCIHLCLCGRHFAHVARSYLDLSTRRVLRLVRHHSAVGPHLRSHRPQKNVYDRRGHGGLIWLSLFRYGGHSDSVGGVHRDCSVTHPA